VGVGFDIDGPTMSISSCGLGHDHLPARALYTPRETQRILSISHAQLYRLIGRGQLDARKIGRGTYITAQSIDRFLGDLAPAQVRST
jgi:Helix-turn-helix domain